MESLKITFADPTIKEMLVCAEENVEQVWAQLEKQKTNRQSDILTGIQMLFQASKPLIWHQAISSGNHNILPLIDEAINLQTSKQIDLIMNWLQTETGKFQTSSISPRLPFLSPRAKTQNLQTYRQQCDKRIRFLNEAVDTLKRLQHQAA